MSVSIWPFIEQGADGVAYIEGTRTKVIEVAFVCRLARTARGTAGNLGENRRRATDSQLCRDRQRAASHSPPDYRSTARARRPQSIPRWKLSFKQQALTQHHARRVIDVQHPRGTKTIRHHPRAGGSIHSGGLPGAERRPVARRQSFACRIGEELAGLRLENRHDRAVRHVTAIFGVLVGR